MKAIVIYGTRFGSTPKVAEEIVKVLVEGGAEAEAYDARHQPPSPEGYDLVVVGSAIRNDSWTRETRAYLKTHRAVLAERRVALFVCCATVLSSNLENKVRVHYLENFARKHLARMPLSMGLFGGCFDYRGNHGLLYSLTASAFHKDLAARGMNTFEVCDFRDWDAIRAWARMLLTF